MGKSAYIGTQVSSHFIEDIFNKRVPSEPMSNETVTVVEKFDAVVPSSPRRRLLEDPISEILEIIAQCPLLEDTMAAFQHAVEFMVHVYEEKGPFAYTLCRAEKFTDSTKICEKNHAPESTGTPPPACVGMCQLNPHGGDAG
jgi:hypothetical protein